MVLTSGLYVDACKEWRETFHEQTNVDWVQDFIAESYHYFKINQKLSAVQVGYHSTKNVLPTEDIASILNNLAMASTVV